MKGGKDSLPQLLARGLSPTKTHAPGWGPGQIVVLGTQAFHPCPETVLSTLKVTHDRLNLCSNRRAVLMFKAHQDS